MTIFLFIFFILVMIKTKIINPFSNTFNENFLDKDYTSQINGIFVIFVFLTHFSGYVKQTYTFEKIYFLIQHIGQGIVCSFLFYSGYGIYQQMQKNKNEYLKKLITKRFLSLLLKFAIVVIVYYLVGLLLGSNFTIQRLLLSLFGWEAVGNSNWYIFYTFISYIMVYVCFRWINNESISISLLFLLNVIYILIMYNVKDVSAFYVTALVFPLGILFSKYKNDIVDILKQHYLLVFSSLLILYVLSQFIKIKFKLPEYSYNIIAILFTCVLVLLTMKISLDSKILRYLGANVFYIYILQCLLMNILKHYIGMYPCNVYIPLIFVVFAITCILSWIFSKIFKLIKL